MNRHSKSLRCRAGFTAIEVLVIISVVALLLAITVPAIQQARESARQSECRNKLRQIALACDLFESAHKTYPPGRFFDQYGSGPDSKAWSFLAQLLPYLDQEALYKKGNIPNETLRNSGVADSTVSMFLCPSDPSSHTGPRFDAGNMVSLNMPVGQTNYKAVSGSNWGADESQGWGPTNSGTSWANLGWNGSYDGLNHGDGMLYRVDYKRPRRKDDVHDGMSNTFLLGEDIPKYDIYCSWPYSNNVYSTCAIPPNLKTYPPPPPGWASIQAFWPDVQSFRSEHPGGLNFSFGDGSVHFINESIDLTLYRALATIRGQEPVTAP